MNIGSTEPQHEDLIPGEKEMREHFEEVTTRNVKAGIDHGNETRRLLRDMQEEMIRMNGNYLNLLAKVQQMEKTMVLGLQVKFAGGTTDYGDIDKSADIRDNDSASGSDSD